MGTSPIGNAPLKSKHGFTLIEILVVLAMIGLLAAIALPSMLRLKQSIEYANQREYILTQIASLGYQAYITGRPIVLGTEPSPFRLPEGWRLEAETPVVYQFNGACKGGQLIVVSPDERRETLLLQPPRCSISG